MQFELLEFMAIKAPVIVEWHPGRPDTVSMVIDSDSRQ